MLGPNPSPLGHKQLLYPSLHGASGALVAGFSHTLLFFLRCKQMTWLGFRATNFSYQLDAEIEKDEKTSLWRFEPTLVKLHQTGTFRALCRLSYSAAAGGCFQKSNTAHLQLIFLSKQKSIGGFSTSRCRNEI